MKTYDVDTALRIMEDIYLFDTPVEDAIANEIIGSFKLPWNTDIDVVDLHRFMMEHSKKNDKSVGEFNWHIGGEFLWCDGEKVKRVLPMFYYCDFSPKADYYEGKILDRAVEAGYFD